MVWKKKLSVFGGCDTHPVMLREIMDEILKIRQEIYELNENELSYPVEGEYLVEKSRKRHNV